MPGAVGTGGTASTTAGRWWAATPTPPESSTASCGTGAGSPPSTPPARCQTTASDINNRAQVVGQYLDTGGRVHGFLWDGPGRHHRRPRCPQAGADGINDRGQIVGARFNDLDLTGARGFLLAKGVKGPVTPISFPGAPRTLASGINDRGQIVGFYENPAFTPTPPPTGTPPSMGRMA